MPRIHQKHSYSGCLSRTTVELVQAALAKGMTHWLVSRGGWYNDRFLRNDKPVQGAVWQRTPPSDLGLTFSASSLRFLIWLTANDPSEESADPWQEMSSLTVGDQLLIFRTLERVLDTNLSERWFRMRKFAELPLVALSFPDRVAQRTRPAVPDFSVQFSELSLVLECLQPYLAKRWVEVEQSKSLVTDAERMQSLGTAQTSILTAYLNAAAQAGRRDLARFLLVALQQLIPVQPEPEQWARRWVNSLRLGAMRLAERTIVYQSASSFLVTAAQFQDWTQQCQQVGYFDEGYAAAQLWLADWARYDGQDTTRRAAAMVRSLSV